MKRGRGERFGVRKGGEGLFSSNQKPRAANLEKEKTS